MFIVATEKEVLTPGGVKCAGASNRPRIQLLKVLGPPGSRNVQTSSRQETNIPPIERGAHFTPHGVRSLLVVATINIAPLRGGPTAR